MRRFFLLLSTVAALASPSWAASRTQSVSVAQLDQILAGMQHQSDDKVAKELEALVLTERVSLAQLAQWQSALPGRRSQQALTIVADDSSLLAPPLEETVADPAPDGPAQADILSGAVNYVAHTLAALPDLYATRTTERFEDDPASEVNRGEPGHGVWFAYRPAKPLHFTRQSTVQVAFRNGVEIEGNEKIDLAAINQPESEFTTAGEFGPILSVILEDAMHGTVQWGYWLESPQGKLAVFRYAVPAGQSTYTFALRHNIDKQTLFPAYHGEITIDPVSGAVLRVTAEAGSMRSQYVMESAIVVDYGSIALGGKNYICPVRGVALLKTVPQSGSEQTQINDATFTGYQLARGDVTAVPAR